MTTRARVRCGVCDLTENPTSAPTREDPLMSDRACQNVDPHPPHAWTAPDSYTEWCNGPDQPMSDVPMMGNRDQVVANAVIAELGDVYRTGLDGYIFVVQEHQLRAAVRRAVLAALPSPAEYVRALADDETLMLRVARRLNFLAGSDEADDAATILRALAAALPTERTNP